MGNEILSSGATPKSADEMIVKPSVLLCEFPNYVQQHLQGSKVLTSRSRTSHSAPSVFGYLLQDKPRPGTCTFPCMSCRRPCFDGNLPKKLRCVCGTIQIRSENGSIGQTTPEAVPLEFSANFNLRNSVPPQGVRLLPLTSVALGAFYDSVPSHCRELAAVDFKRLYLNVLRPFFMKRERCVGLGDYFAVEGVRFKVVGCSPEFGLVTSSTFIQCYEALHEAQVTKVQFASLAPNTITDQMFNTIIRPFFRTQPRHVHKDQFFTFQGVDCIVVAVEPIDGLVTTATEIFFEQQAIESLQRIRLSPIGDTLPRDLANIRGIELTQLLQAHYLLPFMKGWRRVLPVNSEVRVGEVTFRVMESAPAHGYVCDYTAIAYNGEVLSRANQLRNRGEGLDYMDEVPVLRLTMLPSGQLVVIDDRREAFLRQMMQMEGLFQFLDHSGVQGASSDVIESLPLHTVSSEAEIGDTRCTVCLTEFIVGDEARTLPCCKLYTGHYFHKTCIDEWLVRNRLCPLCKRPIDQV